MIQTQIQIENTSGGVLGSLRRFCETGLAILHNRVELVAIELQEEKGRLISMLIWAGVGIFCGFMTVIALMLTLIFLFWEQRLIVAAGFAGLFIVGLVVAGISLKGKVSGSKIPFAESINQIKKDREWLAARQ